MAKNQSGSSRQGRLVRKSAADILEHAKKPATIARLKRLAELPDSEIDFSDIPEMTDEQLAKMRPISEFWEMRRKKERLTVRIDKDVVAWLRSKGEGYQTRLNTILREAMAKDLKRAS